MKRNVYLAGFMGTGKTTVGRALAKKLGRPFVDTDAWIEERAGATVARIFAENGEPHFRKLERRALKAAAAKGGKVVALGGGTLLDPRNVKLASRTGRIVRLICPRAVLWERLKKELRLRPLLQGPKAWSRFAKLMRKREVLVVPGEWLVSTKRRTPRGAATLIAGKLEEEAAK